MPTHVEDIATQALSLPPEERAKLVDRLIASLEPGSPVQAEWLALARSRRDAVRRGEASMVSGDDALARVRSRIS